MTVVQDTTYSVAKVLGAAMCLAVFLAGLCSFAWVVYALSYPS